MVLETFCRDCEHASHEPLPLKNGFTPADYAQCENCGSRNVKQQEE